MRTIKCDKCGYCYSVDDFEEHRADKVEINKVKVSFIICSGQNERVEKSVNMNLCKSCRSDLPSLYEDLSDTVIHKILSWLNEGGSRLICCHYLKITKAQ